MVAWKAIVDTKISGIKKRNEPDITIHSMIPGLYWINTLKVNGLHHGIPYIHSHLILLTAHGPLHGSLRMDLLEGVPDGILHN